MVAGTGALRFYRGRSVHPQWSVPLRDVVVQGLAPHPVTTVTTVVLSSPATGPLVVAVAHHRRVNRALGTLSGATWARTLTAEGARELVAAVVAGGGEELPATIDHRPRQSAVVR